MVFVFVFGCEDTKLFPHYQISARLANGVIAKKNEWNDAKNSARGIIDCAFFNLFCA